MVRTTDRPALSRRVLCVLAAALASVTYALTPGPPSLASGQTWTLAGLSQYSVWSLAVDPTNPAIRYAGTAGNGIFKTVDYGSTWTAINTGLSHPENGRIHAILIDPSNSAVLYAGEYADGLPGAGVFKSTDAGATWNELTASLSSRDVHNMAMDPNNSQTIYAATGVRCGSVWKTIDGGASWTRGVGLPCDPIAVLVDPSNTNILYTGNDISLDKSVDGGLTWTAIGQPASRNGGMAIDSFHPNTLYNAASDNFEYRSDDGGQIWAQLPTSPQNVYQGLITDPLRPDTVYAATKLSGATGVFVSSDRGVTWTDITANLTAGPHRLAILSDNPSILYALTDFGFYAYGLPSTNQPPVVGAMPSTTINQGATYAAAGAFSDPDSWNWSATVDYGDGSGVQPLSLSGTSFYLSHHYGSVGTYSVRVAVTDEHNASGRASGTVIVQRQLVSVAPAQVWIGLKNSDDVGTRFDLMAEVYSGSTLIGSGQLNSVSGGSSGFNNAHLYSIPFDAISAVDFPSGTLLGLTLYVRNSCTGPTHNSGTARLWFNDVAAGAQFGATIGSNTSNYFLRDGFALATSPGPGPKKTIDVPAGSPCSPFKTFGTWTTAVQ